MQTKIQEAPTEQQIKETFAEARGGALATLGNGPDRSFAAGETTVITARQVEVKRQHEGIMEEIRVLAKVAGPNWYYTLPARNDDGTQANIEGPTVKCTDEVSRIYGNCAVQTYTEHLQDRWVITARFVDHERGYLLQRRYEQMKPGFDGRKQSRMATQERVLQIGISKATRGITHHALRTYVDFAFEEAKESFVATIGRNLKHYAEKTLDRLNELGVDLKRVERAQGRVNTEWRAQDVAKIVAQIQSIQDGMMTIDDTWPRGEGDGEPRPTREDSRQESPGPAAQNPRTGWREGSDPDEENQAEQEGYHIPNAVGELQFFEWGHEQDAFGYLFQLVMAAGKANDWKAVATLRDNNEEALAFWRKVERGDLADQIDQVIAMFTPPPQQASAAPRDRPERSDGKAGDRPAALSPSERTSSTRRKRAQPQGEEERRQGGSEPDRRTEDRPADPPPGGRIEIVSQSGVEIVTSAFSEPAGKDEAATSTASSPGPSSTGETEAEESRSEYWGRERLTIDVPKKDNNTYHFQLLRDRLAYIGEEARTPEEVQKVEDDNEQPMRILSEAFPGYALAVREGWHRRAQKLAEKN